MEHFRNMVIREGMEASAATLPHARARMAGTPAAVSTSDAVRVPNFFLGNQEKVRKNLEKHANRQIIYPKLQISPKNPLAVMGEFQGVFGGRAVFFQKDFLAICTVWIGRKIIIYMRLLWEKAEATLSENQKYVKSSCPIGCCQGLVATPLFKLRRGAKRS